MIIAIDGPAASGKSTAARSVAAALGVAFLDTGAMYRAVTMLVQERGVDPCDEEGCGLVAKGVELGFDSSGAILIDGQPGEPRIRGPRIDSAVSLVAAHPCVRAAIVSRQVALGEGQSLVAEGRDTTTVVFPDADHKFFLIASPAERGRRRAEQEGRPDLASEYAAEIAKRDELDSNRAHSPLRQAEDAVCIDTDALSAEEVVQVILSRVSQ